MTFGDGRPYHDGEVIPVATMICTAIVKPGYFGVIAHTELSPVVLLYHPLAFPSSLEMTGCVR